MTAHTVDVPSVTCYCDEKICENHCTCILNCWSCQQCIFTSCKVLQYVYLQFYGSCLLYYFVAVNYGNLLLQALLEHWWRPPQVDEDTDCQGDQQGTGQTQGGNDYFSVPGHTPVIFRCIFLYSTLCLKGLLTVSKALVL